MIDEVKVKVTCAWCGKDMGEKDGRGVEGVSHGICEECQKKHFPAMDIPEPYALQVRAELRRQPTKKLQKDYKALKRYPGKVAEVSAIREVLWERGKLPTQSSLIGG